jgi:hypothetical protein
LVNKGIIILAVLFLPVFSPAQSTREKSAQSNISKHRWHKAHGALKKSIAKDSLNLPAFYLMSTYYFAAQNPDFHIDSAYRYATNAIRLWQSADARSKARWSRFPVDSSSLMVLRQAIDSAAFEVARRQNREEAYLEFLRKHPDAAQQAAAERLRDEVAFQKALEVNTFRGFEEFIKKYPNAEQIPQARAKYEQLLFEYSTRDQRLSSFKQFLEDFPASPWRPVAEKNIFEIATAVGSVHAYEDFLKTYPDNRFARRAANILFHLLAEVRKEFLFPPEFMTDSLSAVVELDKDYLVPILVNRKFGFITSTGKEAIPATIEDLSDDYLCGDISEDVIIVPGKMVTRKGQTLLTGDIRSLSDLGYGVLMVGMTDGNILFHKSGFRIGDLYADEAVVLNGKMLAVKKDSSWAIYTLTGKRVAGYDYQDISAIGDAFVLRRDQYYFLTTAETLVRSAGEEASPLSPPFSEVKKMGDNIWVRTGDLQGLYSQQGQELLKPAIQIITPAFFGAVSRSDNGYVTVNQYGEVSDSFQRLEIREPWVAAKNETGWFVYDPYVRIPKSVYYDSLAVNGAFAVGINPNGVEINLLKKPNFNVTLMQVNRFEFLPGQDSLSFLLAERDKKIWIYDQYGENLFTLPLIYDRIQNAGGGYFVVTKKDKKGLINSKGKLVVPVEYDAIGSFTNQMISLLKAMKFGLFDAGDQKLIKPAYDKNIIRFSKDLFAAFRGTGLGFIDPNGKPLSEFEFSEVRPWTDSVALVKKGSTYQFYNPYTKKIELNDIKSFTEIRDTGEEKLFIITQRDQTGVVSNRRGVVIPLKFTHVVNVGSREKPLYFTEKHVSEASLFVVIYYDENGRMIRREVYEQDEFDRIYCDD